MENAMKKIVALLLVLVLLLSFGSCRKSTPKNPDADLIGSGNAAGSGADGAGAVEIKDEDFEAVTVITGKLLSVGDTYSFARLWEKSGYRSADPTVATVDEEGTIVAVGEGTTMVMAKSGTDEKASAVVICVQPKEFSDDVPLQIHYAGTYYRLSTTLTSPTYVSSNTSVLEAGESGILRFFAPGYAVVTVDGEEGTEQYGYIVYDRTVNEKD